MKLRAVALLSALCLVATPLRPAVLTVTSDADSVSVNGVVTLREALISFNRGADLNADVAAYRGGSYGTDDEIRFFLTTGPHTIAVTAPLPVLLRSVRFDGTTQPGFVSEPVITLDGAAAGASASGLVFGVDSASTVLALEIAGFARNGIWISPILFADGFESGGSTPASWAAPPLAPTESAETSSALVTLSNVTSHDNNGSGLRVEGGLAAANVEISFNAGHGVLVDSAEPVTLTDCVVHDNEQNGVRVLGASTSPYGFTLAGLASMVHDNGGHGVVLGHPQAQTRAVNALVADALIFGNEIGIRVQQKDAGTARTASTILANNIFDNAGAGLYISTSFQLGLGEFSRTISANYVHHNAVIGACSPATADQFASQIVFDGPIADTDPTVSDQYASGCPIDTDGGIPCVPCGADPQSDCMGPNSDRAADFRCYWGASHDGTAASRNDSQNECNDMNDPTGADSGGVDNRCVWNGTQCRIAWDLRGSGEFLASCDSSANHIFAYVNDPIGSSFTQKGVAAIRGAYVNARRNFWGLGGPYDGYFVDNGFGSFIDLNLSCGSVSDCP